MDIWKLPAVLGLPVNEGLSVVKTTRHYLKLLSPVMCMQRSSEYFVIL